MFRLVNPKKLKGKVEAIAVEYNILFALGVFKHLLHNKLRYYT